MALICLFGFSIAWRIAGEVAGEAGPARAVARQEGAREAPCAQAFRGCMCECASSPHQIGIKFTQSSVEGSHTIKLASNRPSPSFDGNLMVIWCLFDAYLMPI